MELFSAARTEVAPGRKALKGCTSHVPQIMVYPSEDDANLVELRVFLPVSRNSYRCHLTEVVAETLPAIFSDYREDPEHTLLLYFNWTAPEPMALPQARAAAAPSLVDQTELL